ncbi:Short-chain dehydrogenase [Geodermatophilus obscurus]|uniref:Short-chain dehydrogenase n=1 Tax=Geodermatophilus obscurus TaxID=1861 RepID=A0A1I5C8T2_9ACTN|nr:SDR family NAD(P)-dependent oxidoreductase [Geodermatophilus obscurus]SFN83286.1 Short-chain dehydrogenase [Geodermatophilus obscurus]
MSRRTAVVTGASSGIGAAAARLLARDGWRVVVVGRDPGRTRAVAAEVGGEAEVADFARLDDVRALAAGLAARHPRIDVLANNAGGVFGRPRWTADGHETTLQVNHLAPFLLTALLRGPLVAGRATVVATSSAAARMAGVLDLGDLDNTRRYSATKAYGDSKLAQVLHTRELQRRLGPQGVSAAAFHPGVLATRLARGSTSPLRLAYRTPLRWLAMGRPAAGGAELARIAAGTPGVDWEPGEYHERGVAVRDSPQAYDDDLAVALWEASADRVGLTGADRC